MHTEVFYVVIVWQLALIPLLAVYALRAKTFVHRALALDTLALVFVGALALLAIHRDEAGFLDVALVLAMLGFAQTVGTVRLVERRRGLE